MEERAGHSKWDSGGCTKQGNLSWVPLFPQWALSPQQGVRLTWRWLLWRPSGYLGGRCPSNNIGTCERECRMKH